MWWTLASVATAGCGVDADADRKWATAPLVAEGEVVSLALVEPDVVEAVVRLSAQRVGRVDSGYLAMRTRLTSAGCPGDEVWPPGATVAIVARPDEAGIVWPSPCVRDVLSGGVDLSAAGSEATAGHWKGLPAPATPGAATFPAPGERAVRVVRLGRAMLAGGHVLDGGGAAAALDARVVSSDAQTVSLVVSDDGFDVAATVAASDVAPVPPPDPEGGVAGGGIGLSEGTWIDVAPGTRVTTPGGEVVLAMAREKARARLVARDDEHAWVLVPTPWGEVVGRVVSE